MASTVRSLLRTNNQYQHRSVDGQHPYHLLDTVKYSVPSMYQLAGISEGIGRYTQRCIVQRQDPPILSGDNFCHID